MTLTIEQKREREFKVCQMIADGKSRWDIADALGRTKMLVDHIVADLRKRHQAPSAAALIAKLQREGVIR